MGIGEAFAAWYGFSTIEGLINKNLHILLIWGAYICTQIAILRLLKMLPAQGADSLKTKIVKCTIFYFTLPVFVLVIVFIIFHKVGNA